METETTDPTHVPVPAPEADEPETEETDEEAA
jgi:hypothetical protein